MEITRNELTYAQTKLDESFPTWGLKIQTGHIELSYTGERIIRVYCTDKNNRPGEFEINCNTGEVTDDSR